MPTRTATVTRRLSAMARRRATRRTLAVRRPPVTTPPHPAPVGARPAVPVRRFRDAGREHVEATLAELAPTIRRFRLLLTVMIVSIPVAVIGGLALLWRLGT
jgi:hypothetical protein